MIVIADSGATKCDWAIVDLKTKKKIETTTKGFNPFFHDEIFIANEIFKNETLRKSGSKVTHVFFYCAGGSSKELQARVQRGLHIIFNDANIMVDHDMDGAAYATCKGKKGIACILGTGSNSCYFDGKKISEEVPSLGFILGDEGSGAYYGKKLLSDYYYKTMPAHIRKKFEAEFKPDVAETFQRVYMKPHANVYLASFMRFCSKNRNEEYISRMIFDGMYEFLNIHVRCFPNYREVPVHFVGSIAYYFEPVLRQHCKNNHINLGVITNKPVDGLVTYHLEKDFGIAPKKPTKKSAAKKSSPVKKAAATKTKSKK